MKKSFLLCLTMLLCCVTGVWGATVTASSGTGTQEDPFVFNVSDGDNVDLQQGQYGKFVFAASAAGNLSIRPSGFDNDCYQSFTYGIADDVMQAAEYDGINGIIKVDGLEAGLTYQIVHSVASYENCNFSFEFDGGGGDEPGGGVSEEGTLENPWVATAGEELPVSIPMFGAGYVEFTPEADGTLKLTRTVGFVTPTNVYIQKKGESDDTRVRGEFGGFADPSYTFPYYELEAGTTYLITLDCSNAFDAVAITLQFNFTETTVDPNAFRVIEADPADGSSVAAITLDDYITVTVNRTHDEIGYMRCQMSDYLSDAVSAQFVSEDLDAGTSTWTVRPTDMSDVWEDYVSQWVLYEGTTYRLTLEVYETAEGAGQGQEPIETTYVTYEGATETEKFSDIKLIRVTPGNDATEEEMLNEENHVFEIEFDGKVEIESMNIAQGQFGSIPLSPTVEYTDEGHTIVKADVGTPTRNDYIYAIVVTAKDAETGLYLNDPDPELPGVTWAGYAYSFDIPCSTGRWFDTSLGVDDITPLENSYVTKLDRVYFTMTGAGDQDGYYGKTANAEDAALYNEAGDMVAYATLWQDDERGREEFDPSQSVGGMGGEAVYVDGTTKYFYAEFTDLNGTGTPVEITTPGKYTLRIPQAAIGDGDFELSAPWLGPLGSTERGNCNPEFEWTFNVVESLVEVESVDPVPYNVSGEFNEEIPAEITMTFSDKVTIDQLMIQYGERQYYFPTEEEYSLDGNTLTIKVNEELQQEGNIVVNATATAETGQPVSYGISEDDLADGLTGIIMSYQTPLNILEPVGVTPAEDDETVTSLSKMTLTFDRSVAFTNYDATLELKDAEDNTVATATADIGAGENEVVLRLDKEVNTPGTYTLTIPAESIYDLEGVYYNPEFTLTFNVYEASGIDGIKADADGNVKVYTVDGVYVGQGKAVDMLGKLAKGIYIINGTKVAVK